MKAASPCSVDLLQADDSAFVHLCIKLCEDAVEARIRVQIGRGV